MKRFNFSRNPAIVALFAMIALTCKNGGRVLALASVSRCTIIRNRVSHRSFNSRGGIRLMSTVEGGADEAANVVVKLEKVPKEKKEKKEKGEKKEKVVAAVPGIEEIRVARVNKLAAMREAGNVSILSAISSMIPKYI